MPKEEAGTIKWNPQLKSKLSQGFIECFDVFYKSLFSLEMIELIKHKTKEHFEIYLEHELSKHAEKCSNKDHSDENHSIALYDFLDSREVKGMKKIDCWTLIP